MNGSGGIKQNMRKKFREGVDIADCSCAKVLTSYGGGANAPSKGPSGTPPFGALLRSDRRLLLHIIVLGAGAPIDIPATDGNRGYRGCKVSWCSPSTARKRDGSGGFMATVATISGLLPEVFPGFPCLCEAEFDVTQKQDKSGGLMTALKLTGLTPIQLVAVVDESYEAAKTK